MTIDREWCKEGVGIGCLFLLADRRLELPGQCSRRSCKARSLPQVLALFFWVKTPHQAEGTTKTMLKRGRARPLLVRKRPTFKFAKKTWCLEPSHAQALVWKFPIKEATSSRCLLFHPCTRVFACTSMTDDGQSER